MRKQQVLLGVAALLISLGTSVRAAQLHKKTQHPSAQVMILGVSHLEARRDVHNSVFEDSPLSSKRQAQIAEIIRRLSRFHPTKVLVEAPMDDPKVKERYRQYLAGQFALPADEVYQFGFKLAAHAGNSAIYPIDTFGPGLINDDTASGKRVVAFLKTDLASVSTPSLKAYLSRQNALERTGTYLDLLRYLNTDAAIRANASFYSVFDGMGRDADNAGSLYVSDWYTRNCYIFSNILSVIRPGDRVVVIMGQGHKYLLREFVQLSPNLVSVDALKYLQ